MKENLVGRSMETWTKIYNYLPYYKQTKETGEHTQMYSRIFLAEMSVQRCLPLLFNFDRQRSKKIYMSYHLSDLDPHHIYVTHKAAYSNTQIHERLNIEYRQPHRVTVPSCHRKLLR